MSGWLHSLAALPLQNESSIPTEKKLGCAPEPVWTLWIGEKFLLSPSLKRQLHSHPATTTNVIHYTLREMEVILLDISSALLVTEPTVVYMSGEMNYNSAELFPHIQSSVAFLARVKFDCYTF